MKVSVDREKCMNSGMCTATAPKIFKMDEETAMLIVLQEEIPDKELAAARDAVACCPVSALRLD